MTREIAAESQLDAVAQLWQPSPPDAKGPARGWPTPIGPAAYHGVLGDILGLMEPNSEADPAALLIQALVCVGNMIGRGPHWRVESTTHYANLNAAIIGESSNARKGTSLDNTLSLVKNVDEGWATNRITSGLSSGEGLIWAVRDPMVERVAKKEKGRAVAFEMVETDPGAPDKRLLVVEPEFARVLSAAEREGNTLSPILRNAWDGKPLNILTKRQAGACAEPHISIIAHITTDELLRLLSDTAIANGFANRFLFVCARRSRFLPFGGDWDSLNWAPIISRLDRVIDVARVISLTSLSSPAREKWAEVYPTLTSRAGGLLGAVTGRAEAQVRRIALLYTLLDGVSETDIIHLDAALEVWRYCLESCRFIFGDSLGDPTADEISRALKQSPEGLSRKSISDLFQRHKSTTDITRALDALQQKGLARMEKEDTGGRPTERWFSISSAK